MIPLGHGLCDSCGDPALLLSRSTPHGEGSFCADCRGLDEDGRAVERDLCGCAICDDDESPTHDPLAIALDAGAA